MLDDECLFEFSISDKDIGLIGLEDEYLLLSEDFETDLEFNSDVVDDDFVLGVEGDSPIFNINDPYLFFIVHQ
jgi:hypothetical protein